MLVLATMCQPILIAWNMCDDNYLIIWIEFMITKSDARLLFIAFVSNKVQKRAPHTYTQAKTQ